MAHERRAVRRKKKMALRKARTAAEKDRAKDLGLQRKYGITLAEREHRAAQQNNLCKICGGPLDAHGYPCVDHFHFKIQTVRETAEGLRNAGLKWCATAYDEKGEIVGWRHAKTKTLARASIKQIMMPWSIRGILCGKCNYGLGMVERFFDAAAHPENLLPVIEYLRNRLTAR
jgi:hypothetical protein